jgi:hypothetical protein
MNDPVTAVAEAYRSFARQEARGRSAAYESLAESVTDDPAVVAFIASLPAGKRQPSLLFAAARYLLGVPPGIQQLRDLIRQSRAELTQVILTRRTQTNEPARCAVLLPALAQLPQPLALIEAGASAGLTLLFDRYSYDYAGHRLVGSDPAAPILRCEPRGPVPLTDLPALAAQAPAGATLVIYHTSVLYQVAPDEREQFAGAVRSLGAVWLSSEAPGILPGTAAPALDDQMCVIARDGRPIAFADSHGTWLQWRDQ